MKISLQRYQSTDKFRRSWSKKLVSSPALLPILFVVVFVLFACVHIWQRVYVLGLVKEVGGLEKEREVLTDLSKKTNAEIMDLSRVSRVEQIVSRDLGMARTSTENMLTLVVKKSPTIKKQGELDNVVSSLKKLADNLPVINESRADTMGTIETNEN